MTASHLLAAALLAASPQQTDAVIEPRSGASFPKTLEGYGYELVGAGVRTRTIFRVKIYAVGLYVDSTSTSVASDAVSAIRDGRVGRGLRLIMTRTVDGEAMREAFEKAMRPRFERARSGTEADWRTFASFFDMNRLEEGTRLVFTCSAQGKLETTIDRRRYDSIDSEALCFALFDVYVGAKPISKRLRKDLLSGATSGSGDRR